MSVNITGDHVLSGEAQRDKEADRLLAIHPFDDSIVENVAEVAGRFRASTWQHINDSLPESKLFIPKSGKAVQVLDTGPNDNSDEALVYHLAMATGLDENSRYGLAALAAANPDKRIVAVGNPGPIGQGRGKISIEDAKKVWRNDLSPLIEPTLDYLNEQGIDQATHVGYSYGADKAATATINSADHDIAVSQAVLMEPASIRPRSIPELGDDFMSTEKHLQSYIDAANAPSYSLARQLARQHGLGRAGKMLGMLRPTNLAISRALSKDGFEGRVDTALSGNPDLKTALMWGSDSELANDRFMDTISRQLIEKYGQERVKKRTIQGHTHAMAEDVFLRTALVAQGLKDTS